AGELFLVDVPVAQAAEIIVALAEPSVVHHHQLYAHLAGSLGDGADFFSRKIKERGLPVIDEDGPALLLPGAATKVAADGPVEQTAHMAQSSGREDHGCIWGGEGLAGLEGPGKVEGMDAQGQPRLV